MKEIKNWSNEQMSSTINLTMIFSGIFVFIIFLDVFRTILKEDKNRDIKLVIFTIGFFFIWLLFAFLMIMLIGD